MLTVAVGIRDQVSVVIDGTSAEWRHFSRDRTLEEFQSVGIQLFRAKAVWYNMGDGRVVS